MLAYEMAQQLSAQGREVDLVAVIDTGAIRLGNGASWHLLRNAFGFLCNLPYWIIDDILQTHPRDLVTRIRRQIRAMRKGRGAIYSSVSSKGQELEDLFDIGHASSSYRELMESNLQAFQQYTPKPYSGRITLLRALLGPCSIRMRPTLDGVNSPTAESRSRGSPATTTASCKSRWSERWPRS